MTAVRINKTLSPAEREKRDRIIIDLRAHGYSYQQVSEKLLVSGRLVRDVFNRAGKPQYLTSADWARRLSIDRSTVLRHSIGKKKGRIWNIEKCAVKKPYKRYSNNYQPEELEIIGSDLSDREVAEKINRSENAVHIKRWRIEKARSR